MAHSSPRHTTAGATAVRVGATLVCENLTRHPGASRRRPHDDTLLRTIAGLVRLRVDDRERVLGPGEEALIPAGSTHQLCAAAGEARILVGLRPA